MVPTILWNGTERPVPLNTYSMNRPVKMLIAISVYLDTLSRYAKHFLGRKEPYTALAQLENLRNCCVL